MRENGPWPSLLILGPTGSGKTPLGEEIERRGLGGRRCVHFDFGANLRRIAAGPDEAAVLAADELAAVRASFATGALFEDRDLPMIVRIVEGFAADRGLGGGDLLVLNGLPRHVRQAEGLADIVSVEIVVELDADAAVVRERLRIDPDGDRSGRADDSCEAVARRLADFDARTRRLVGFYHERGVRFISVPVGPLTRASEMYAAVAAAFASFNPPWREGTSEPPGSRPSGRSGPPGEMRGRR